MKESFHFNRLYCMTFPLLFYFSNKSRPTCGQTMPEVIVPRLIRPNWLQRSNYFGRQIQTSCSEIQPMTGIFYLSGISVALYPQKYSSKIPSNSVVITVCDFSQKIVLFPSFQFVSSRRLVYVYLPL